MRTKSAALAVALALSAAVIAEPERPRFLFPHELKRSPSDDSQKVHSHPPRKDDGLIDDLLGPFIHAEPKDTHTTTTIVVTPTGGLAPPPTSASDGRDRQTPSTNSAIVVNPIGFRPAASNPATPGKWTSRGPPILNPRPGAGSEVNHGQSGPPAPSPSDGSSHAPGGGGGGGGLLDPISSVVDVLTPLLPPLGGVLSPNLPFHSKTDSPPVQPTKGSPVGGVSLTDAGASQNTSPGIQTPVSSVSPPPSRGGDSSPAPTPTPEQASNVLDLPPVVSEISSLVGGVGGVIGIGGSSSNTEVAQQSSNTVTPQDPGAILGVTGIGLPSAIPTEIPTILPTVTSPTLLPSIIPSNPISAINSAAQNSTLADILTGIDLPTVVPTIVPTSPISEINNSTLIDASTGINTPTLIPSSPISGINNSTLVDNPTSISVPSSLPTIVPTSPISEINNSTLVDILTGISLPTSAPTNLPTGNLTDTLPTVGASLPTSPIGNNTKITTPTAILTNVPTDTPTITLPTISATLPTSLGVNGTSPVPTNGSSSTSDEISRTSETASDTATPSPTGSTLVIPPINNSTSAGSSFATSSGTVGSSTPSPTSGGSTSTDATGSSSSVTSTASNTKPPVTAITPTATLPNSSDWLPSNIVIESTSAPPTSPTQPAASGGTDTGVGTSATPLPSNIPKVIAPDDPSTSVPEDSVMLQIGFSYPLNWVFVANNTVAASQIFTYLPMALAFSHDISVDAVHVSKLVPEDTRPTLGYVTTLAMFFWPRDWVEQLQMDLSSPSSLLYNNPDTIVNNLTAQINPAIPLQPQSDPSSPSDPSGTGAPPSSNAGNDAFGNPSTDQQPQSSHQVAATAGIALGAVGLGTIYGAAMFIMARRYKRKKQAHRRASSVDNSDTSSETRYSEGGSPALMGGAILSREAIGYDGAAESRNSQGSGPSSVPTGRAANISNPVAAENSLGWT